MKKLVFFVSVSAEINVCFTFINRLNYKSYNRVHVKTTLLAECKMFSLIICLNK